MLQATSQRGFTLLELLIAVAILTILSMFAIPSWKAMTINNRGTSQANNLVALLTSARGEAIRRNRVVTLCKIRPRSEGDPPPVDSSFCSTDANLGWENGVLMFVLNDSNSNGLYDGTDALSTQLIRADVPLGTGSTIVATGSNGMANSVSFTPTGLTAVIGSFVVTPIGATTAQQKTVVVSFGGRARVK